VTPYVTSKCNSNPTAVTGRRLSLTIAEERKYLHITNITTPYKVHGPEKAY